jgi:peptidoglycan/LPS O-acetylase OafA/YrhL
VERPSVRRPALDGLRALAAVAVVVHHCWQYSGRPRAPLGVWWNELALAVPLFFCLSGFLVYGPWARGRPPRVGRFYALRAARVLPLYWVSLVAAIVLLYGTGHWRLVDDGRLLGFAVLAQNYAPGLAGRLNPPSWSLAVEVSFYAVVPLIGLAAGRSRVRQVVVLFLLTAASIAWARLTVAPPVVRTTLPDVLGLFCVGMAARVLVEGRTVGRGIARALLLAGFALVAAHGSGWLGAPLDGALRDLPAGAGFALVVVACASPHAPRVLTARPLVALGTWSYGIYLWHYPILLGLQAHGLLPAGDVLATCALVGLPAVALAALSWRALERPALQAVATRLRRPAPQVGPVVVKRKRAAGRPGPSARVPPVGSMRPVALRSRAKVAGS